MELPFTCITGMLLKKDNKICKTTKRQCNDCATIGELFCLECFSLIQFRGSVAQLVVQHIPARLFYLTLFSMKEPLISFQPFFLFNERRIHF